MSYRKEYEKAFKIEHMSTSMLGVDFTDKQCKVIFKLIDEAKKEVFDDDIIKYQFACLESWCASRHEGKGDYCRNCRRLNELMQHHLSTSEKKKEGE